MQAPHERRLAEVEQFYRLVASAAGFAQAGSDRSAADQHVAPKGICNGIRHGCVLLFGGKTAGGRLRPACLAACGNAQRAVIVFQAKRERKLSDAFASISWKRRQGMLKDTMSRPKSFPR